LSAPRAEERKACQEVAGPSKQVQPRQPDDAAEVLAGLEKPEGR